jgi:hypothetical protein
MKNQLPLFDWPYISKGQTPSGHSYGVSINWVEGEEQHGYNYIAKSAEEIEAHEKEFMNKWYNKSA